MEEEKIYFKPGDLVQVKHNIGDKPIMWVIDKKTMTFRDKYTEGAAFKGIVCRWYDRNFELQEKDFNTKDLIKL